MSTRACGAALASRQINPQHSSRDHSTIRVTTHVILLPTPSWYQQPWAKVSKRNSIEEYIKSITPSNFFTVLRWKKPRQPNITTPPTMEFSILAVVLRSAIYTHLQVCPLRSIFQFLLSINAKDITSHRSYRHSHPQHQPTSLPRANSNLSTSQWLPRLPPKMPSPPTKDNA
jgi:hypothetical protein